MSDSRDARARGARFLEATGGELERCAVAVLVGGGPVQPLHEVLARRQRADGAFADPSRPDAASLVETRRAIGLLGDLRALQGPVVERACERPAVHGAGECASMRKSVDRSQFARGRSAPGRCLRTQHCRRRHRCLSPKALFRHLDIDVVERRIVDSADTSIDTH